SPRWASIRLRRIIRRKVTLLMNTVTNANSEAEELPIACNLPEAEMSARGEEVTEDIFSRCEQMAELPDGYAFRFPGSDEWATKLLYFVLEERKCCPFFVFEIRFDPQEGPIWLHLRGGEN